MSIFMENKILSALCVAFILCFVSLKSFAGEGGCSGIHPIDQACFTIDGVLEVRANMRPMLTEKQSGKKYLIALNSDSETAQYAMPVSLSLHLNPENRVSGTYLVCPLLQTSDRKKLQTVCIEKDE